MEWWQILILCVVVIVVIAVVMVAVFWLSLKLFLSIFLTDENYEKWIKASDRLRKIMRIKGIDINKETEELPNGGL